MSRAFRFVACLLGMVLAAGLSAAQPESGRWSAERANQWHERQPWLVGCNFTPSTAINQLEMWQADTFDPETIDRELGWAAGLGMNTVRVYLHDLLWEQDAEGFLGRVDRFLTIADKHGIRPMLVLCDACWDPQPKLGRQPEPRPHIHNSGWLQSPHIEVLRDPARHDSLEGYVKGVIGRFKADPRVLAWDLYNEPGNAGAGDGMTDEQKEEKSLLLMRKIFAWAREVNPSQPLTAAVWHKDWSGDQVPAINRFMLENSDVISFHNYENLEKATARVESLLPLGRPILCSEYLARGSGSTFESLLPLFKKHRIGAINWGLVAGKIQTQYPWSSWKKPMTAEPALWHHDILRPDGRPFRQEEVDLLRSLTGRGQR